MMVIAFKGLGNSLRGKTLWQIACLTLLWMVWQERNNRIFEDKGITEEMLWDLLLFYSSLWAFCTAAFRGVLLKCFTTQLGCGLHFKSLRVLGFFFVFSFLKLSVFSFVQFFVGRTSHPSLVFFSFCCISSFSCIFSSINIFFFVSDIKKIKINNAFTKEEITLYLTIDTSQPDPTPCHSTV